MKLICAIMLALGTVAAHAQVYEYSFEADPATTLANLTIGQPPRRYSVRVRNCASSIESVMLRVADAGIEVSGAGVLYTDGSNESYNFSYSFPAGYDSPWISIDSFKKADKCVKSVFVIAQSADPQIKSHVRVFGN